MVVHNPCICQTNNFIKWIKQPWAQGKRMIRWLWSEKAKMRSLWPVIMRDKETPLMTSLKPQWQTHRCFHTIWIRKVNQLAQIGYSLKPRLISKSNPNKNFLRNKSKRGCFNYKKRSSKLKKSKCLSKWNKSSRESRSRYKESKNRKWKKFLEVSTKLKMN